MRTRVQGSGLEAHKQRHLKTTHFERIVEAGSLNYMGPKGPIDTAPPCGLHRQYRNKLLNVLLILLIYSVFNWNCVCNHLRLFLEVKSYRFRLSTRIACLDNQAVQILISFKFELFQLFIRMSRIMRYAIATICNTKLNPIDIKDKMQEHQFPSGLPQTDKAKKQSEVHITLIADIVF